MFLIKIVFCCNEEFFFLCTLTFVNLQWTSIVTVTKNPLLDFLDTKQMCVQACTYTQAQNTHKLPPAILILI